MNNMGQPSQENFESMEYLNDDMKEVTIKYQTIYRYLIFFTILGIILFFLKKKIFIHI